MRKLRAVMGSLVLLSCLAAAAQERGSSKPCPQRPALARLPLAFVANHGQWDTRARFVARGRSWTARLEPDALVLQVEERADHDKVQGAVVRLTFEGCSSKVQLVGERARPGTRSYFLGRDESRWRSHVPAFASVLYRNLFEGVDLRVREGDGCVLEYDVLVAPGVDPGRVKVRCDGASRLELDSDGSLVLKTAAGPVRMKPPVSWEESASGGKTPIACRYEKLGPGRFTFTAPDRRPDRGLVIDPGLEFSTYLGGTGYDSVIIALDSQWLVVAGHTDSPDFPTTPGAYRRTFSGGTGGDVFVARLSLDGKALVYATYFGGSSNDGPSSVFVSPTGAVYIAGETYSTDFPITPNAFCRTLACQSGAFVARFSPSGGTLVYSTFLDGSSIVDITGDSSGRITMTGRATPPHFPTTMGAYRPIYSGGMADAFVARLSADGSALDYATFLGGAGYDEGIAVELDATGAAVVAGNTDSRNLPTTPGAFSRALRNIEDAFVARISPDGSNLTFATYLGGSSYDYVQGMALDASGAVVVVGSTLSWDFPTTPNAVDPVFNPVWAYSDGFVAVLAPGGGSLLQATYLGGSGRDVIHAIRLDAQGNAVVAGMTYSSDFPTTPDAFDTTFNGVHNVQEDAFVTRFPLSGRRLAYSTYLGGTGGDLAGSLALDATGNAIVAGQTTSTDFPTTPGALSRTLRGTTDGFVTRLSFTLLTGSGATRPGSRMDLDLTATSGTGLPYQVGSSLGTGPIAIDTRKLNLSPDGLLVVSTANLWPSIFSGYRGLIDTRGLARAAILIPTLPALIGVRLHSAFVTLDPSAPSGVAAISNTFSFSITK